MDPRYLEHVVIWIYRLTQLISVAHLSFENSVAAVLIAQNSNKHWFYAFVIAMIVSLAFHINHLMLKQIKKQDSLY